jgi:hypothetical protein
MGSPRAIATLIAPIPTVLSRITTACPVFAKSAST